MITVKQRLNKKEEQAVSFLLNDLIDVYKDFYITKNKLRLFIKENKEVLFKGLRKGNLIAYNEKGLAIIVGFSDKHPRKYLKCLAVNEIESKKLIQALLWNVKFDLYAKIKRRNELLNILKAFGFKFKGSRGQEILLERKYGEINNVN